MEFLLILVMTISSCVDSSPFDAPFPEIRSTNDTDENEPWTKHYLPKTIVPTHYELFIFPNFYLGESSFRGNVTIHLKVLNETNTIIVHMKKITITSTSVIGCRQQNVTVTRAFEYKRHNYWVIQTATPLSTSCTPKLMLVFNGNMETLEGLRLYSSPGLFKSAYVNDITGKQSWVVATVFQPSSARLVFPNFDEPQFKTHVTVKIRHWRNLTALSNMIQNKCVRVSHGWVDTVFKRSPKMSSSLISFIVGDFVSKHMTLINGKMHRVWARPDRIDKADYALNISQAVDSYLQREFQLPYPLDKLDHVAVPRLPTADAIENWGIIAYENDRFLFDVTNDGDIARQRAIWLITHEMSHNYFGNLVTCRYWTHVWLNEGIATFYDIKTVSAIEPSFSYKEQHFAGLLEDMMVLDSTTTAEPLVPVLTSPDDHVDYFNIIRYIKGAAILRMVENFLGVDTFRRGIRGYLKEHEYKSVVTDHLWIALEKVTDSRLNLRNIMKPWIYDNGFPVITVRLLNHSGYAVINATQKQFLIDPLAVSDKEQQWFVPLNYRLKRGNTDIIWLNKTGALFHVHLNSEDDWIEFNYDMSGYYRVKYDDVLLNRITRQLNKSHTVFSVFSRSKLISDALNLAKAEQSGYDKLLDLTRYASKETGFAPWVHIYSSFFHISKRIYGLANYSHFQRYFLKLTSLLMDKLQVKDEGSLIQKLLRPKIMAMACSVGHRGCIENTTRLFKAWIQNETINPIPVNFRTEAYCIGVANSKLESEWNTVLERFMSLKTGECKTQLLKALTCSRNVTLLGRLLENSTEETKPEFFYIKDLIIDTESNVAFGGCIWKWLKGNNTSVDERAKSFFYSLMLAVAVENFKTREQRQELSDFLGNGTSESTKRLMLKTVDQNIRWMDRNFATIVNWLERNTRLP